MMPTYDWYGLHPSDDGLEQGLILPDFPLLDYSQVDYRVLSSDEDLDLPIEILKADLILMTQSCDLHQQKVNNVTLCRIYPLSEYISGLNLSKTKARQLIDKLNSNQVMNMILLEKPTVNPYHGAFSENLLVKFDESINYPVQLLNQRIELEQGNLLKLLPPYREALSQNYGLFFMRVGNPEDREKIYFENYDDFIS